MIRKVLLFTIAFALPAHAHDFWIEPSTFRPVAGKTFTASLRVGTDFAGDPVPRSAALMDSFVVRDAAGERAVNGLENQDPAGFVRVDEAGTAVIGYKSKASPLEITPEKFAQFLREEGIGGVTVPNGPHRENFYRFAKTLVRVGNGPSNVQKPLGYRLELVPANDPFTTAPLQLKLVYETKPLANALITAISAEDGSHMTARSDAQGRAALKLGKGVWLIKATHLVRTKSGQWESLWASLTFER
ncbi:MAG: DUF4198 domain-containing protein [Acidobacteriota bacterium]|nr:DUF4198 domain-containing protein [Acidobacteriota bacterium]